MHTTASLKAEHKTLAAAKTARKVKAASWQALADKLNNDPKTLKARIQELEAEAETLRQQMAQPNIAATAAHGEYFVSAEAEIIYKVTQLDGEQRLKALGINRTHYRDVKKAKDWRNSLAMKIHPDKCAHPHAAQAIDEVTALYQSMVAA
jgi:cell division protein FtsB